MRKYNGQIANFPEEVVEKMLERQVEQGNRKNIFLFEENKCKRIDGFTWYRTVEGFEFWNEVIKKENFALFFQKYPKKQLTFPREMMVSFDGTNFIDQLIFCKYKDKYLGTNELNIIQFIEKGQFNGFIPIFLWSYAKEIESKPNVTELTLQQIADKFNLPIEQIRIKK